MNTEYRQKEDVIDLYNILGLTQDVCSDPRCQTLIRDSYLKKVVKCHPDKNRDNPEVMELFELIQGAYEILSDEKQRTNYNQKLRMDKQSSSSFSKLKKTAADYGDGSYKKATSDQQLQFTDQMKNINTTRGYDVSDTANKPIPKKSAKKQLQSFMTDRESDLDYKPEKLFESDKDFDGRKFNELFDIVKKQAPTGISTGLEIVESTGAPAAWNGGQSIMSFGSFATEFDTDLADPFADDSNGFDMVAQPYGNVHSHTSFGQTPIKVTKDMLDGLQGADYYDNHNDLEDDYYDKMKEELSTRVKQQSKIEDMGYGDYDRSDTAGYGIFDQLGFKFDDRLTLDLEDDNITARFERALADRQKRN